MTDRVHRPDPHRCTYRPHRKTQTATEHELCVRALAETDPDLTRDVPAARPLEEWASETLGLSALPPRPAAHNLPEDQTQR